MRENEALQIIYNYRHTPDPAAVPSILELTQREKFLRSAKTAIGWSGVIVALCERHPEKVKAWEHNYGEVITQACRVANSPKSYNDPQWANHLVFRWMVLGEDKEAWALLCRAHHKDMVLCNAAQIAIESICMGVELHDRHGRPITDTQGTVLGRVEFPDMREQMMLLTNEFRKLTWAQRVLPFSLIPFSAEYRLQREGLSGLGLLVPATGLLQ